MLTCFRFRSHARIATLNKKFNERIVFAPLPSASQPVSQPAIRLASQLTKQSACNNLIRLTTYRLHVIIHHTKMKIYINWVLWECPSTFYRLSHAVRSHEHTAHTDIHKLGRAHHNISSGRNRFLSWRKTAKSGKLIRSKNDFTTMINGTRTTKQ